MAGFYGVRDVGHLPDMVMTIEAKAPTEQEEAQEILEGRFQHETSAFK